MKFGAGEETSDLQFDPRCIINIVSTGHVSHKMLVDYKIKSLRRTSINGIAGLFMVDQQHH